MINIDKFLNKIDANNKLLNREKEKQVLVIFELENCYIGDTCRIFSLFRECKSFFFQASIDVCCNSHFKICNELLTNNPYINSCFNVQWHHIEYTLYDTIIVISDYENILLNVLVEKISSNLIESFTTKIFSLSNFLTIKSKSKIFEEFVEIISYTINILKSSSVKGVELFLSDEEINWGNNWLSSKNLLSDEKLIILVDSASRREKLLPINVHFQILLHLLNIKQNKVLIFDEKNIGKKEFYLSWLGAEVCDKLIFAEGLSLRQAMCIIGSKHTSFVFGPCTGLLHCASGIFKTYLRRNYVKDYELPLLIVYTGIDKDDKLSTVDKWTWWGDSLAKCLIMKEDNNGSKNLLFLDESNQTGFLTTKEYTSDQIIDLIKQIYG